MMKKMGLVILAAAVMLAAAAPAFAKETKIGHANLQRALNECDAGVKAKAQLEDEAKKLEDELNAQQEDLKKMKDEIDKMGAVWNKETKDAKEADFRTRSEDFRKKFMDYGDELNKKKQDRENLIIEDLRSLVDEIAKKKGYSYVFEKSIGGLLYAPASDDITDEIIKAYNKRANKDKDKGKE
ncbi:MAG: OmpH family outer membrane protein [Deltaproteobacteria bacterium]|nr:OmpH family outer membrane protein [Deltaproteobacteria bacterium]